MDAADRQTLDRFLQAIRGMRVHRDGEGRPALKKPLLLLLILDRLASGKLSENRISFSAIEEELTSLIKRFGRRTAKGSASPEEPFVYLATASFWTVNYPEGTPDDRRARRSKRVLRDAGTYASLDDTLFELLRDSGSARKEAMACVLECWAAGEAGDELRTAFGGS